MKNEHSGKETRVIHYGQIERGREGGGSGRKSKVGKKTENKAPAPPRTTRIHMLKQE